jgi:cytosine/adenosine deaminase-related metal-dependent hydrolase
MSAENRVIVKVDAKPRTPAGWLAKSKAVYTTANDNAATFASIAALLTQLDTDSTLLDKAQAKAANRGKLEIKARDAQWRVLQTSLRAFVSGVQRLCDAAPDAAHAQAIAAAAALDARLVPVRLTPDPRGKALGNGAVRLYGRLPVPKRGGAFFEWAMSTDGGHTWAPLPGTNTSRTLVLGLTPATIVSFRYRTTFKNVTSDWSQTAAVIVH